jgi:hypothetical protein
LIKNELVFVFNFEFHQILASGTNGLNDRNTLGVPSQGKPFTTDTEEDETMDYLLKSAMTVPKGQPPKKRTKKYGERKSCELFIWKQDKNNGLV